MPRVITCIPTEKVSNRQSDRNILRRISNKNQHHISIVRILAERRTVPETFHSTGTKILKKGRNNFLASTNQHPESKMPPTSAYNFHPPIQHRETFMAAKSRGSSKHPTRENVGATFAATLLPSSVQAKIAVSFRWYFSVFRCNAERVPGQCLPSTGPSTAVVQPNAYCGD